MRLFCDANIMVETVEFLRQHGHDAISTRDVGLSTAPDDEVLGCAIKQDRVLLTFNADFGDIRLFPVGTHAGIIRLRLAEQAAGALHPVLGSVLDQLRDRDLSGKLVTASKNAIRIRGLA